MNDSEVAVEHLVEQLRKIVDVQHVENLTSEQTVARELARYITRGFRTFILDIPISQNDLDSAAVAFRLAATQAQSPDVSATGTPNWQGTSAS